MNNVIPIHLAVEDLLSEVVLRVMLQQSDRYYAIGTCLKQSGFGYLKKKIAGFNNAAKGSPFLVLTDLDKATCAPVLIKEWLSVPKHKNLIFRIAVRSVEAWLLADRKAFAAFLGIRKDLVPLNPDDLIDPKKLLIELTRKSRKRELREAIIPPPGSTAKIGPDYNGTLTSFVMDKWDVKEALKQSPSLTRAFVAIQNFQPIYKI